MHAALNMLTSEPASVHQGHDQLHHRHRFWIQMGSPLTASCPLSLALRPLCENQQFSNITITKERVMRNKKKSHEI